jgi:hypothetical protein
MRKRSISYAISPIVSTAVEARALVRKLLIPVPLKAQDELQRCRKHTSSGESDHSLFNLKMDAHARMRDNCGLKFRSAGIVIVGYCDEWPPEFRRFFKVT